MLTCSLASIILLFLYVILFVFPCINFSLTGLCVYVCACVFTTKMITPTLESPQGQMAGTMKITSSKQEFVLKGTPGKEVTHGLRAAYQSIYGLVC